jgi:hypothetical protein
VLGAAFRTSTLFGPIKDGRIQKLKSNLILTVRFFRLLLQKNKRKKQAEKTSGKKRERHKRQKRLQTKTGLFHISKCKMEQELQR